MLFAASISTWAYNQSDIVEMTKHCYVINVGNGAYKQLLITSCQHSENQPVCTHSLAEMLKELSGAHYDLIMFKDLDEEKNKIVESVPKLDAYALDLRGVENLGSWKNVKNQYVSNVLFKRTDDLGWLDNSVVENFNPDKLYNVMNIRVCNPCHELDIDVYINKPGFLANGLQYISELDPEYSWNPTWWNDQNIHGNGYSYKTNLITMIRVSGCVFARDLMAKWDNVLTPEGHLRPAPEATTYQNAYSYRTGSRCTNPLAPSYSDPNVVYIDEPGTYGQGIGAMLGSHISEFDFTNAEFGEYVMENGKKVFKYYPADMTLSALQEFAVDKKEGGSVEKLLLPKSSTQYIIPEGFLHDSWYIHELCIPSNYTEIHGFAFLGTSIKRVNEGYPYYVVDRGGINRFTTTAAKDGEMLGILKGEEIDNGPKTLTLPSTLKFVGRGAFSGYGGAALLEDVYVLAEKAPVCEFYAFDQKTYVGQDSHTQGHLIKKGNYVNLNNGMAMLHFPNTVRQDGTLNQKEMLNYSDMTRKYRLYDETGHFDNVGNILVWPTQAQYNRSFNQALAGVTWWAWKENLDDSDNPEMAFAGGDNLHGESGWIAGCGDEKANHNAMFTMAARANGFSDKFTISFDDDNPNSNFNPSEGKSGHGFSGNSVDMNYWDRELLSKSVVGEDESVRPLSYDFVKYGGWHQFTIAELYDFMLEKPGPKPDDRQWFNFKNYNKNIWYAVCFPFNLTKAQLLKALGNPETEEYPFVSTLASVVRDSRNANITVVMSKNLLKYNLQYESGKASNTVKYKNFKPDYTTANYGDNDIVIEANKPYFILPSLPEEEIVKAAALGKNYNRKSEITAVKQEEGKEKVMFPVPTHVHAVKGTYDAYVGGQDEAVSDTAYAYNYYFVGNYIPQEMPENAYYLKEYQKKNGDYWSSFYRNTPKKADVEWSMYDAIVMAKIDDKNNARSKGVLKCTPQEINGKTHNYIWTVEAHNDWVFFEGTGNDVYAKSAFGMQVEDNFTTSIQLPDGYEISEDSKVYNLNGQFVGFDSDNMPKGIYVVGGKKIVK